MANGWNFGFGPLISLALLTPLDVKLPNRLQCGATIVLML